MSDDQGVVGLRCEIRSYDRSIVGRSDFSCGKAELDEWLRTQAGQQERRNNTRTFLAVLPETGSAIGYYATATYRVDLDEAALAFGAGKHRYPIPAALLARLAVDQRWHGRGIGRRLLADAVLRLAKASELVGFQLVVVEAIDDEAITFYLRYGFQQFEQHPRKLFMTTAALRQTVRAVQG